MTNPDQLQGNVEVSGTLTVQNPFVLGGTAPEYVLTVNAQADHGPVIGGRELGGGNEPAAAVYASGGGIAVYGDGTVSDGTGVQGTTQSSSANGVFGSNSAPDATPQGTVAGYGVFGLTTVPNASGVFGANNGGGTGVAGESANGTGVQGTTQSSSANGVFGSNSATDATPQGTVAGYGVFGLTTVPNASGVFGANNGGGTGVLAVSSNGVGLNAVGGTNAAVFDGSVQTNGGHTVNGAVQVNGNQTVTGNMQVGGDHTVTGTLSVDVDIILVNQDCAEEFDVSAGGEADPGTVMVLGAVGKLEPSHRAYDKRVAGVVSGAGEYQPGLILGRRESPAAARAPIALIGTVLCKADASYGAVEAGDLLTTSPTPGHAMKAADPLRAFGTVIGKALADLPAGQAMIPILVALQ